MKKALTFVSVIATTGFSALAQVAGQTATQGTVNTGAFKDLLGQAQGIVSLLVPFFISLAVIAFFWFLIKFIFKGSSDAKERSDSLKGMGFSVLALFVMVSIWGLVGFLGSVFGIGQGGKSPAPCLPGVNYAVGDPCH